MSPDDPGTALLFHSPNNRQLPCAKWAGHKKASKWLAS